MQCNAPVADEVWGSYCSRIMGGLRADACVRGARRDDTCASFTVPLHTLVFSRPHRNYTLESGHALF
jgi:hypothetical protein